MVDLNKTFEWKDSIDITVADLNVLCDRYECEQEYEHFYSGKSDIWGHLIACYFHCNIDRIPRATKKEIIDFVDNYYETIYRYL